MVVRLRRHSLLLPFAFIAALVGSGLWSFSAGAASREHFRAPNVNNCRTLRGPKSCIPPAPGQARLHRVKVLAHKSGKFRPFFSRGEEEELANEDFAWRVIGKAPRGKLAPTVDPVSVGGGLGASLASAVFNIDTSLQDTVDFCRAGACNYPPDMSTAQDGQTVLETGNWKSFGAVSTNGGATFSLLDPTTIFPSGPAFGTVNGRRVQLDGGMCCDQVVQYVPQINRFIWLMQFNGTCGGTCGTNKERIAAASPDVVAHGGTWTYWDLTSATYSLPSATPSMDYPDLAVGTNDLYVSFDNVGVGLLVSRIPLSQIAAGSSITIGYTTPTDSATAYGGHLTQNVRDTAYWAGQVDNKTMRIFSMKDSDNVYHWRDIAINSWCNGDRSSDDPNGTNWLSFSFPGNAVLGSTLRPLRSGNELWFAWDSGHAMASGTPGRCGFPQTQIQIEVLRVSDYHALDQMQVWNRTTAFAYPSLASDPAGDVAMSVGYGGGGNFADHAVGFWGDFVVYTTTAGDDSITRFGDFETVRRSWPETNLFSAAGYSTRTASKTNGCPSNGTFAAAFGSPQNFCFDPHYVQFHRG